jgi:hypothetical protein
MPKAVVSHQQPTSPGSPGTASVDARTRRNPPLNGGTVSPRSRAGGISLASVSGSAIAKSAKLLRAHAFDTWPPELDSDLKKTLASTGHERQAIDLIRGFHPEIPENLIWARIVYLGLSDRIRPPYRKHIWSREDDDILQRDYGRSRSASHAAIEEILRRHPEWSRDSVVWRAHSLGLGQAQPEAHLRWSPALDHRLLSLMGCQLDTIAHRLSRSRKSIQARLRRLGYTSDFFDGFKTKDLILDLRVTDATVVRWTRLGWIKRKAGRVTEESLRWLCRNHPEEITFDALSRDIQNWLRLSMDYGRGDSSKPTKLPKQDMKSAQLVLNRSAAAG